MLRVDRLEMDLLTHSVSHAGKPVELLPQEFRLLECLMRHAGQVVTCTKLFEEVWNYHHIEPTNVIDVHIVRLRRKTDPDGATTMIQTVRGAGYILRAPD
jgi:two-component system, OmpR family, response regulator